MWLKSKSGDDDMKNFPNWDQEFQLEPWPEDGLFDEYLEMGKLDFYVSFIFIRRKFRFDFLSFLEVGFKRNSKAGLQVTTPPPSHH